MYDKYYSGEIQIYFGINIYGNMQVYYNYNQIYTYLYIFFSSYNNWKQDAWNILRFQYFGKIFCNLVRRWILLYAIYTGSSLATVEK